PMGRYRVDPRYGGPEYESLAALGVNLGLDDLIAICKSNEMCNYLAMDTVSLGCTLAWAMECFEKGILTLDDTGGVPLRVHDADGSRPHARAPVQPARRDEPRRRSAAGALQRPPAQARGPHPRAAGKDRHRLLRRAGLGPGDRRADGGDDQRARARCRRGPRGVATKRRCGWPKRSGSRMSRAAGTSRSSTTGSTSSTPRRPVSTTGARSPFSCATTRERSLRACTG